MLASEQSYLSPLSQALRSQGHSGCQSGTYSPDSFPSGAGEPRQYTLTPSLAALHDIPPFCCESGQGTPPLQPQMLLWTVPKPLFAPGSSTEPMHTPSSRTRRAVLLSPQQGEPWCQPQAETQVLKTRNFRVLTSRFALKPIDKITVLSEKYGLFTLTL